MSFTVSEVRILRLRSSTLNSSIICMIREVLLMISILLMLLVSLEGFGLMEVGETTYFDIKPKMTFRLLLWLCRALWIFRMFFSSNIQRNLNLIVIIDVTLVEDPAKSE